MTDLSRLLQGSSRTFALAVPLLPEPTCTQVTLAYLLFRIADTFEDAEHWPVLERVEALRTFDGLLQHPDPSPLAALARRCAIASPSAHPGYRALLDELEPVLGCLQALPEAPRRVVVEHLRRTVGGMARTLEEAAPSGRIQLESTDALRAYCYLVAGIVGEMLTELFLLAEPGLSAAAPALRARAAAFGEGLQLVNILKDADADAREGRRYVPADAHRSALVALARHDLAQASEYATTLQQCGAARGVVAFTALPVLLAEATLQELERRGPGAKVPREQVAALFQEMNARLDRGAAAVAP